MILKIEDALKSLRRTDPECEACRDLRGSYYPPLAVYRKKQYAFEIPRCLLRGGSFICEIIII